MIYIKRALNDTYPSLCVNIKRSPYMWLLKICNYYGINEIKIKNIFVVYTRQMEFLRNVFSVYNSTGLPCEVWSIALTSLLSFASNVIPESPLMLEVLYKWGLIYFIYIRYVINHYECLFACSIMYIHFKLESSGV